jgi:hypothetical protein
MVWNKEGCIKLEKGRDTEESWECYKHKTSIVLREYFCPAITANVWQYAWSIEDPESSPEL